MGGRGSEGEGQDGFAGGKGSLIRLCVLSIMQKNNVHFQSFTINISLTMLNLHRCLEDSFQNLHYYAKYAYLIIVIELSS